MKSALIVAAILAAGTSLGIGGYRAAVSAEETIAVNGKSAYVCDYETQTCVYAKNETVRLPIASMCKIMTLLLTFEAVENGELSYDEAVCVSERASSMGGSQVFLDTGLSYRAEDLMRSVAVCSANDSCVALSERVAGSEDAFVERMNDRARELGADNTLFANCTGLPKDPQYSCAKDAAVMLSALLKHDKYYEFCKVWNEDFAHPDGRTTQMTNTNKLIRAYEGCDGGKTGFTNEAGFCLAATAKRGDMRVVSVIIGAESAKVRNKSISDCFNYCFDHYENKPVLKAGEKLENAISVCGSKIKEVSLTAKENLTVFQKKGENGEFSIEYDLPEQIKAPVAAGDRVGYATLYVNGMQSGKTELIAMEEAKSYTWWEAYRDGARKWN